YILSTIFVPGDRHVLVGLKNGTLLIIDIAAGDILEEIPAHSQELWSICLQPDQRGCVTGGGDQAVKFWQFELIVDEKSESKAKVLSLLHLRTLKLEDGVLCVRISPNGKFIAVSLLDSTVKIFFVDTFKFYLSLYGHKLPGHVGEAWALSVSPNGQFVVSCGADRVLRLYEKSDQPLVLQDEQEEEREQGEMLATGEQTVIPGQTGLNLPSKKTVGSEKGAESILECLEICEKYKEVLAEHEALQAASTQPLPLPQPPLLMQALNVSAPDDFLLETVKRIRPSDLEEALLLLPFTSVCEVLQILPALIARGDQVELVCKILMFLLKLHHAPIVANQTLLLTLKQL
ncbi:WD repeat-containing protein 3, partial [Asbolus verrucosus]